MIKFWRDQVIFTLEKHSRWWLTKTWRIVLLLSEMSVQVQQGSILLLAISPLFSLARAVLPELCPAVPRAGAGHSLAQVPPARAARASWLPSVSQLSHWAGVSQPWDLGWGSCLLFSASLWSNNYQEAGENTGLDCNHLATWKFTSLHQKLSINIQEWSKWVLHSGDSHCSYSLNVSCLTSKARRLLGSFITDYLQASFYQSPLKKYNKTC